MKEVSIVICTKNSAKYLDRVIKSVKKLKPFEIIVVDGQSIDGTRQICKTNRVNYIMDSGIGIGNARNEGLKHSKGDYILYVGPDNIINNKNFIIDLVKELETKKWIAITARTEVKDSGYIAQCMNLRNENRIVKNSVIGSPFLFKRIVLKKYKFNSKSKWSDDTDLCDRLNTDGYKFGYSDRIVVQEVGYDTWEKVGQRFYNYGISDREYFISHYKYWISHYKYWGIIRIIKSLLHPITEFKTIKKLDQIQALPFVMFIIIKRYMGYIG